MARTKKTPLRKCVATREMKPKQQLIRIVKNQDGDVFVDETGKKNGRGAYLSKDRSVIDMAEDQDILSRHLNTKVGSEIYDQLKQIVEE
ncbi:RNase P modulator RnpM [Thalassobacillus sp. CUG 92003]|uniref:RNase P modulator RnpM n=1 Tax=Thalassobacillus sp. CUG 92003 TaxID=2736641 RepID=UPI0015E7BD8D|nr:YlxR family protein [Thalassobacillus sp. CUG 92003]